MVEAIKKKVAEGDNVITKAQQNWNLI